MYKLTLYRSFNLDWLESAEVEILQLIENDNKLIIYYKLLL